MIFVGWAVPGKKFRETKKRAKEARKRGIKTTANAVENEK